MRPKRSICRVPPSSGWRGIPSARQRDCRLSPDHPELAEWPHVAPAATPALVGGVVS